MHSIVMLIKYADGEEHFSHRTTNLEEDADLLHLTADLLSVLDKKKETNCVVVTTVTPTGDQTMDILEGLRQVRTLASSIEEHLGKL